MSIEVFGESLPSGWEEIEVGKLGHWVTGSTPSSKKSGCFGDGYPFVTPGDIDAWGKLNKTGRGLSDIGWKEVRAVSPPSVLLVCIGTIGKVSWTDIEVATNQQINALSVDTDRYEPRFISLLFSSSSFQKLLWDNSSSTTVSLINKGTLSKLVVSVPPLREQKKIVEILEEQLSRLDAALASVRAVREKSERFRRSLLHAAFSGTLTGHDSSSGDLPSGWKEEQLGEIADVGWGDLQVTKSSFIDSGFIAYSAAGPDGFREGFDFDQDGIVLSAIGAGCGRTWYAKGRWSCIKNTIRILEKSDEIKLEFLYQQLSDPNAWPKRGSGQPFISQKDARELMVKVPPLSEQAEIVQILEEQLSRLDASLAVANAIEKKASAFRRSLLHAAFSGNLTKEWREGAHV
jgi:type I restriction enzyme S subunit